MLDQQTSITSQDILKDIYNYNDDELANNDKTEKNE